MESGKLPPPPKPLSTENQPSLESITQHKPPPGENVPVTKGTMLKSVLGKHRGLSIRTVPPNNSGQSLEGVKELSQKASKWTRGKIQSSPGGVTLRAAKFLTKETGQQWEVKKDGHLETKFPRGEAKGAKERIRSVFGELSMLDAISFRQETNGDRIIDVVTIDRDKALELGRSINPLTTAIKKTR